MNRQSMSDAGYSMLGAGAWGWPREMLWGGRWEGGSCLGTHVRIKDFKIKKKFFFKFVTWASCQSNFTVKNNWFASCLYVIIIAPVPSKLAFVFINRVNRHSIVCCCVLLKSSKYTGNLTVCNMLYVNSTKLITFDKWLNFTQSHL